MKRIVRTTWFAFSMIAIALLVIAASCDDDDREPGAPAGTGAGTPSADFGTPTPNGETAVEGVPGDEVEPEATVPPAGADDGTPSTSELPAPEATGTPAMVAERTVTPDSDVVGPQDEGMFPDIRTEAPDLDNYTLAITGEIQMDSPEGGTNAPVELRYEQSDPETFHLFYDGDDEFVVEVWRIGDQMWVREEGEVTEASEELADDFDISVYLTMLPEIERIGEAEEVGQEDVDGQSATHYTVPADEAVQYMPGMRDAEISDAEGSMEIWVADDNDVVIRMVVDLTWTGENENEQVIDLEYTVSDIGETEEIQVPES